MLLSLQIKNFILIDFVNLDFQKGFYVITGETGSGKSVLLDALLFVLGEKLDFEPVKSGAEMTSVIAEFLPNKTLLSILDEHGIESKEVLIIKRQQYPGGKKKIFINDEPVTAKLLSSVADELIEMHGQHSHSILLDQNKHIEILDQFGELQVLVNDISQKFSTWQKLERDIDEIQKNRDSVINEIDFLTFAVKELSARVPYVGEEEELATLRIDLQNASKNQELLQNISSTMERFNILSNIGSLQRMIERHAKNESFEKVLENLVSAYSHIEEAENEVANLSNNSEKTNLDEVETRLFEIRALARKYNVTPDELPTYYEKSKLELENLESRIQNIEALHNQAIILKKTYVDAANSLSESRKKSAKLLENRIQEELIPLKMGGCKWMVEFAEKDEKNYASNGFDIVRFTASTNPGIPSGPIDKIASGGELARLMLAVKVALFDKFSKPTIIFDEIDTGIGGSVADAIGARLKTLSEVAQVIVITHQPQVVAKSNFHILVQKKTADGQTSSSAQILDIEGKKNEIARMLSGKNITSGAITAAEELMKL